ncbi:MAG TPA: hypothetical protein VF258_05275, partial [Luteolibacter sp.]
GGPGQTHPHTPFAFGDVDVPKPMIYYQTIAWAVNYGLQSYLDSALAYQMFRALPETDRAAHGRELLESGLALNPYNIVLADAAQAHATSPQAQIRFFKGFLQCLASVNKPGCPQDNLYRQTVRGNLFTRVAKLPLPNDAAIVRDVLAFLREEQCTNADVLVSYQVALDGVESVARETGSSFRKHLDSARTAASCKIMAGTINAVATRITDKKLRDQWTQHLWLEMQGHENYFDPKHKILTDDSATALAKLNRTKLASETERNQPLLVQVLNDLRVRIDGQRDPKTCKEFANRITTVAKQIKDPAQSKAWLEAMAKTISGREQYPTAKGKPEKDPAAETIAKLLAAATA